MKKFIIPVICYALILVVLLNVNPITNFLASKVTSGASLTISEGNSYAKDYDFKYIKNSKDYIPYSYTDLLEIIYSVINQGWHEFTFYCPNEYTDCTKDITAITNDEHTLTHLNNFVHPYNSFNSITTSIKESGEITVMVNFLYTQEEIEAVNNYVDKVINELYNKDADDYENLKKIHDYIINNTKYDTVRNDTGNSAYHSYIAYGPVVEGYATCNGYADLMAVFLTKLGYQNYKIATTKEEISYESNGHVWNALFLNDKWVHLDLTWDDPVSKDGKDYLYHKYFLVTNEELQKADNGEVNVEEHNFNKYIYQEFA